MIEDGERFFATHPDPETRKRGLMLIDVIDGLRDNIQKGAVKIPHKLATLRDFETQLILDTLREHDWHIGESAKALDIGRSRMYDIIEREHLRKHFPALKQKPRFPRRSNPKV